MTTTNNLPNALVEIETLQSALTSLGFKKTLDSTWQLKHRSDLFELYPSGSDPKNQWKVFKNRRPLGTGTGSSQLRTLLTEQLL